MKLIVVILNFFIFSCCYSQQSLCGTVNDTLFVIYAEIFKPKMPTQQFWCTTKQFKFDNFNKTSLDSFVNSFLNTKNYCPVLPDSYREEVFRCLKDSAAAYLEKLENSKGNIYELFDDIKNNSLKAYLTLDDGFKIRLSIIKQYGDFWIRDIENDKIGFGSDEYHINKSKLLNKIAYIPLKTFPITMTTD